MTSTSSPKATSRPLVRSDSDRHVAGVAGGLADHLGVDPLLIRVLFGVTTLISLAGLLAYLILWAVMPETGEVPTAGGPMVQATP
jgi:phage shock protein PspC (stress-responsive transcriptional regulator)